MEGGKQNYQLSEQIILTLIYLRHLTTLQLLGIRFGVSETTAHDIFNYWVLLLRELLPSSIIDSDNKYLKSLFERGYWLFKILVKALSKAVTE